MLRQGKTLKRKLGKLEEMEENMQNAQEDERALQNSLDSDEDDEDDKEEKYNVMDEEQFEGVEDCVAAPDAAAKFTAFNLKEELEEGTFNKEGHFVWKKEKLIKDHWLDNIDWVKIKSSKGDEKDPKMEDSDSEEESSIIYNPVPIYQQILKNLKPGETVSKALCRLGGGNKKMTTAERWKRKKDPKLAEEDNVKSQQVTNLTELANELLTKTGNMDIYQESYEQIKRKIDSSAKQEAELDMYADDFSTKEKSKLGDSADENEAGTSKPAVSNADKDEKKATVSWELKWSQDEEAEIHGPHTTEQMQAWAEEGYFKKGAWARKQGHDQFYSASRIDFDLYL